MQMGPFFQLPVISHHGSCRDDKPSYGMELMKPTIASHRIGWLYQI